MRTWSTTLTTGAIRNCNISLKESPFHLRPFLGGTNEDDAPDDRLSIEFVPQPTVEMWVYGDKKLLTADGRKRHVQAFFDANRITDARSVEIEVTEVARGKLRIRKVR